MRNMKKIITLMIATTMTVSVVGCGGEKTESVEKTDTPAETVEDTEQELPVEAAEDTAQETSEEEPVLVVYTARSEALNNAVIPEFEKDTGIKVEAVVAGTGELLKHAESEKENPLGDIFWAADRTMLESSKDLFIEKLTRILPLLRYTRVCSGWNKPERIS